jgi:hypothetical protein
MGYSHSLEREQLLGTLNSERFADSAPATVHATLIDESKYQASVRTIYRLLAHDGAPAASGAANCCCYSCYPSGIALVRR